MVVAAITLWPSPVDDSARPGLLALLDRLHAQGVPTWVDYAFVERAANVVMFVPYGALLAVQLPSGRWWLAVAVPALTSVLIEVAQGVALPARYSSGADVVANSAGAVLGVVLAAGVVAARDAVPARREDPPDPRVP